MYGQILISCFLPEIPRNIAFIPIQSLKACEKMTGIVNEIN